MAGLDTSRPRFLTDDARYLPRRDEAAWAVRLLTEALAAADIDCGAASMDDLVYWFGSIVGRAWDATKGQRQRTLAATILLLVLWALLAVTDAYVFPEPAIEPTYEQMMETAESWLGWLRLVLIVGMWPLAVAVTSRLVGLEGCGPRLIVAVGVPGLLLVGLVLALAG